MDKGFQIALKRIQACKQDGSTKLDLGSLGLTELPECIVELESLEELDLGNENFERGIVFEFGNVGMYRFKRKELIAENKFSTIPIQISKLKNLRFLNLYSVSLERLDKHVSRSLRRLSVKRNNLVNLEDIEGFENLVSLDASFNNIKTVSNLFGLKKIESLYLSHNNISDFDYLSKIKGLKRLFIGSNAIDKIHFLSELIYLEHLELAENSIEGNLLSLNRLKNLKYLSIQKNSITSLDGIEGCSSIESLHATNNLIRDIAPLKDCKRLKHLYVGKNEIESFNILDSLPALEYIIISNNKLKSIPPGIVSHTKIRVIEMHGNKDLYKSVPVEILAGTEHHDVEYDIDGEPYDQIIYNCRDSIVAWQRDIEQSTEINNSVRVILCGNGRVGKSSILDRLKGREYDSSKKSTHAIEIEKIVINNKPEDLECWVWDMGGQEVYHTTHQVFMNGKSIFLVVWDKDTEGAVHIDDPLDPGTKYPNYRLRYWLQIIRSINPENPIIVVQNKVNIHDWAIPNSKQVPPHFKIKYFVSVSAETNDGIEILKRYICEAAREIPDYRMTVPYSWWQMRKRILDLKAEGQTNIIGIEHFHSLSSENGVPASSVLPLLRFFQNTSLCYSLVIDSNHKVIINQRWAIEPIYRILERGSNLYKRLKKYHRFDLDEIMEEWGEGYSFEEKKMFLSLMEGIDVCFKINSPPEVTVPEYFVIQFANDVIPKVARESFNPTSESLYLKYRYGSLNYHLIQQFIVQTGRKTSLEAIWKHGIYFALQGNHALVQADRSDDSINIRVQGSQSNFLMSAIRHEFSKISNRGPVEALFSYDGTNFATLKSINDQLRLFDSWAQPDKDRLQVWDVSGKVRVDIKRLLWAINLVPETEASFSKLPDVNQGVMENRKLIFISYANEDLGVVKKIVKLLGPFKSTGKFDIWYDINLGQRLNWDDQIQEKLLNADLFIVVMSVSYLESEKTYIRQDEEPRILNRWERDKIPIFPLLIDEECVWEESTFNHANVNFPQKGKVYKSGSDFKDFIKLVTG